MTVLLIMLTTVMKKNIFEKASHSSLLLKILHSLRENHRQILKKKEITAVQSTGFSVHHFETQFLIVDTERTN